VPLGREVNTMRPLDPRPPRSTPRAPLALALALPFALPLALPLADPAESAAQPAPAAPAAPSPGALAEAEELPPNYRVNPIYLKEPSAEELRFKALADEAYSKGDLLACLAHLRAAFEVSRHPRYIANQGLVYTDLGRYKEAAESLEYFISTNPPPDKRRSAQQEINLLRPEVKVVTNPPGADLALNTEGRSLGTTPLKVRLLAGEHPITLTKNGYDTLSVSLYVIPGKPVLAQYKLMSQGVLEPAAGGGEGEGGGGGGGAREAGGALGASARVGEAGGAWPAGATLLTGVGGATLALSAGALLAARGAVVDRDAAPTRAAWSAAQGEAGAYNAVGVGALALGLTAALSGLVWGAVSGD